MEKFPSKTETNERLRRKLKPWMRTIAIALLAFPADEALSQDRFSHTNMSQLVEHPPDKAIHVHTLDGNQRWYKNPQSTSNNIRYSIGATQSPYKTYEGLLDSTKIPRSLTATDFYTNYLNALGRSDTILFDSQTGQPYQDPASFEEYAQAQGHDIYRGVRYEGSTGAHWNVHRFLIEPHYVESQTPMNQARLNAAYDMYRYFLVTHNGDRGQAQQALDTFMEDYVDRVTHGRFVGWWQQAKARMRQEVSESQQYAITSAIRPQQVLNEIVEHNQAAVGEYVFSRRETVSALIDYFIEYERLDLGEARDKAEVLVLQHEEEIRRSYQDALGLTPQAGYSNVPADFNEWDPMRQQAYLSEHPSAQQQKITAEDINRRLSFYKEFKWEEGSIIQP